MKALFPVILALALPALAHAKVQIDCVTRVNDGEWKTIQSQPSGRERAYRFFEHFNAGPGALLKVKLLDQEMFGFDQDGHATFDGNSHIEIEYKPKKNRFSLRIYDEVSGKDYRIVDRPKKDETYEILAEDPRGLFGGSSFRKIEVRCDVRPSAD